MKHKKIIVSLVIATVMVGISAAMFVFVQADDPLRPSDVREAKPAEYINEQASKTKVFSDIAGEKETLTYDVSVERNGEKDRYLDEEGNKYYYNKKGELTSYVRGNPSGTQQKTEAAAVPDEKPTNSNAENKDVTESAPETDPLAIKIPKEMMKTMTEDELRIVNLAWQKGLELYGDKVAGFELRYCRLSPGVGGDTDVEFAKKYGKDGVIYGENFNVAYDWYGELVYSVLYDGEAFDEINEEDFSEYTQEQLTNMAIDRLAEEKGIAEKDKAALSLSYEFKQARLRKRDEKIYLTVLLSYLGGNYSYVADFDI